MRLPALVAPVASIALVLGPALGCGGGGSSPSGPAPQAVERSADPIETDTALPADLPERLEIEVRRRTEDGEDRVLKLTPAGARYGLSHGKARIALRYRLDEAALASAWATLRREGFDRMETVAQEGPALAGGTSLRVSTGTETYSATAMGRRMPAPGDAEAYARCLAALEELLPAGRSDVVVTVRWDASMRDRSAGLDVDVGTDLVGLHRVPSGSTPGDGAAAGPSTAPPLEAFELHLARARPLQLQLRQGGARAPKASGHEAAEGADGPRSTTLTVQAGVERGVEVAFDAARGEVVARPWPNEAAPPAP